MKKLMIGIGLLLAVTLVSGCQETVEQQDGKWVKIVARAPQTKTVNDGLDTKWSSTDGITVFHATAGSDAFVCDGEFVISDKDNGVFRGELASALEGEAYDWYLLYPYASSNTNPAEMAVTIGGASQTQSAAGSMSHVAGEICPLYAVIGAVGKDQTPGGEMSHLASVIEVNVKNLGSEDLTVSEIGFVASEDVVGNYKVDITGTSPVYVKAGESEVSSEITLSLTESAVIQPSDSAQFYLVVKPFVAPSGSSMKVIVNETEFDLNPAADASFSAGKIKKVNVSYPGPGPDPEFGPNLVKNGDFESETQFEFWTKKNTSGANLAIEAAEANVINGLRCMRMTGPTAWSNNTQIIDVEAGKTYEFGMTGRILDKAGAAGSASTGHTLNLAICKADDTKIVYAQAPGITVGDNIQTKNTVTIPNGVTSVQLNISKANGIGYADDVYFKEVL